MKLRQLVLGSCLAFSVAAMTYTPVFAEDAAAPSPDATSVTTTTQTATTKKAVRAANRTFSRTVHKALSKTTGLDATSITVFGDAKTGRVTLAGYTREEQQNDLAVDAAQKVQGVTSVSSKLTVRQEGR
ncbi:BON domain-containing protein [Paraburkholderia sp. JHI869]|uniref:BON domain-containing protein n=1 Tax=Paraburkholderia sp. JHI869 TaxID=3112959 RepID=UPI00316E3DBC